MKKQKAKKLHLNRETLRSLQEGNLRGVDGAAAAPGSFLKPCTQVVSDCYKCTGQFDTCPTYQRGCSDLGGCPTVTVAVV
ncbi:MAG TPA: class I lanthipeptide [Thermoanaerobaculia bacterium]|nr:class I lanthipeptide [Thermoanaerobaculia bacterium]